MSADTVLTFIENLTHSSGPAGLGIGQTKPGAVAVRSSCQRSSASDPPQHTKAGQEQDAAPYVSATLSIPSALEVCAAVVKLDAHCIDDIVLEAGVCSKRVFCIDLATNNW